MARVLVVEDDELIRSVLEVLLDLEGVQSSSASNGIVALEAVRADPPDVIFLDLDLPGRPGIEVLRALKSDPNFRHIPVIIISAYIANMTPSDFSLAYSVISKPFEVDHVLAALRAALNTPTVSEAPEGMDRQPRARQPGALPSPSMRVVQWTDRAGRLSKNVQS